MKSLSNLSSLLVLLFISSISNAQLNQNQQTNAPALTNGVGLGVQFYTAPP